MTGCPAVDGVPPESTAVVVVAAVTTWVSPPEEVAKLASPPKVAAMTWEPPVIALPGSVQVATDTPGVAVDVRVAAEQPAIGPPPSVTATVPVGKVGTLLPADTVTVYVTATPSPEGDTGVAPTVVVVEPAATTWERVPVDVVKLAVPAVDPGDGVGADRHRRRGLETGGGGHARRQGGERRGSAQGVAASVKATVPVGVKAVTPPPAVTVAV